VLQRLGVAPEQLPPLFSPRSPAGGLLPAVARETGLRAGIPVSAAIHDQYAAALATSAVRAGTAMVGTGTAWVLLAATESLSRPVSDRGFCCHHVVEDLWGQILSLVNGGSALAWALKLTGHENSSPGEINQVLESAPPGCDGLQCWPFFAPGGPTALAGNMAGRLSGLQLAHGPGHVIRAVLEGLACELARHIGVLRAAGMPVERLILGGAGAASRVTPQILAAMTGLPLACAGPEGGSPLGAAILARGLIEPATPLTVLAGQMAPVSQAVEPGPAASFYRQHFEHYLQSLPQRPPS
jgi:xylulokinase